MLVLLAVVRLAVAVPALVLAVAVPGLVLLLWECLELEGGAALGAGERPVGVDVELADAVVSMRYLKLVRRLTRTDDLWQLDNADRPKCVFSTKA